MDTNAGDSTNGALISAGDGVSGYGVGVDSVRAAQAEIKERRKRKDKTCFIALLAICSSRRPWRRGSFVGSFSTNKLYHGRLTLTNSNTQGGESIFYISS